MPFFPPDDLTLVVSRVIMFVTVYSRCCTQTVGYSSILGLFFLPKKPLPKWGIPSEDLLIECGHMTASIYYEGLQHHAEIKYIHVFE